MTVQSVWYLALLMGTTMPQLSAQSGISIWWGVRGYHGGPSDPIEQEFNFKPVSIRELGASYHLASLGRLRLSVAGQYLDGAYGAVGEFTYAANDTYEGYSFRVPLKYPLMTYDDVNVLMAVVEPGIEAMMLAASPSETRVVVTSGLEFAARASRRIGVMVGAYATVPSKSFVPDSDLPDGVENETSWWTSLRVGLRLH